MSDQFSEAWVGWRERIDLDEYDARWDQLEAQGKSVHDEADFVDDLGGQKVLDAGCGTGRIAVELARRGRSVVGTDLDADMLAYARRKPEPVRWEQGNLATIDCGEVFDTVLMAGNILVFAKAEDRPAIVANLARHMADGGALVIGSSVAPDCQFAQVDTWCKAAGLELSEQYSTWDREAFDGGDYRVSIHRKPPTA